MSQPINHSISPSINDNTRVNNMVAAISFSGKTLCFDLHIHRVTVFHYKNAPPPYLIAHNFGKC